MGRSTTSLSHLQRRRCALDSDTNAAGSSDITWYGAYLAAPRWDDPESRTLCFSLAGEASSPALGRYVVFAIFHAGESLQPVRIPAAAAGTRWHRTVDTSLPDGEDIVDPDDEVVLEPADEYLVNSRSTVVLVARAPAGGE